MTSGAASGAELSYDAPLGEAARASATMFDAAVPLLARDVTLGAEPPDLSDICRARIRSANWDRERLRDTRGVTRSYTLTAVLQTPTWLVTTEHQGQGGCGPVRAERCPLTKFRACGALGEGEGQRVWVWGAGGGGGKRPKS